MLDVTWRLLDEESNRDSSFMSRAIGIAGFAGVIGALAGSVSKDLLTAPLAEPYKALVIVVFVVAMVALAATALFAIVGVLLPKESLSLGAEEVRRYPTWDVVGAHKVMEQGRALRGLTHALLRQRERNNRKAQALTWAYISLLTGLLAIVALGLTLGLHRADVIPTQQPRTKTRPAASGTRHHAVRAANHRSHPPRKSAGHQAP